MKFLLKQYKFHNVCSLDYLFASFLNDFLTTRYPGFPLIPVPSGKKRIYRESRLSKMEKITNILKRKYGMEVYPVLTMKKGIKQKRLSAEEREKNILGRVKAVKKIHKITGQSVLLLDDVYTTGSTMSECGRILLLNGVREVHGITLFRD